MILPPATLAGCYIDSFPQTYPEDMTNPIPWTRTLDYELFTKWWETAIMTAMATDDRELCQVEFQEIINLHEEVQREAEVGSPAGDAACFLWYMRTMYALFPRHLHPDLYSVGAAIRFMVSITAHLTEQTPNLMDLRKVCLANHIWDTSERWTLPPS